MQHRHKSVEDFKTDVDTLYDLLHENPDNHESRVYLIEVLTECLTVTRQIIAENQSGLELSRKYKILTDRLKALEKSEDEVYAGQVAFGVEESIIRQVEITKRPHICCLNSIKLLEEDNDTIYKETYLDRWQGTS